MHPREWRYGDQGICLKQGKEMGRYLLGSTVALLLPKGELHFNPAGLPGLVIQFGEVMAGA